MLLDCACGKSYLSFVMNYYIHEVLHRRCRVIGVDIKEHVIDESRAIAKRLGYHNMTFICADLRTYQPPKNVTAVISLHACDIATDLALGTAIRAKAKYIACVPCCHKELLDQYTMPGLEPLTKFGVFKARFNDVLTDSMRALKLEAEGYKVSVVEYISPLDTPKNLLIRATRTGKVNNRAVSIREQLRNGDIVEILTQKNQTPKSDWLNFVVTSKARNKIKSFLREEQAKHTRMGREELERKLKNWKFPLTIDEAVAYLVKYFKVRTGTEIYALIATRKVDLGTIKEILTRHISGEADEQRRAAAAEAERNKVHNAKESPAAQDALVIDDDISKIQYKLAKCCNPIKGDEVFGFVTINSGITIHRCDCPNAKRMRENYPYRVIDARWRSTAEGAFRVSLRIVAADTTGMANHITEVISRDLKLNIRSINFASLANGCIAGTVSVEVPGAGVVDTLIHSIMRIKGVQRAFRINN